MLRVVQMLDPEMSIFWPPASSFLNIIMCHIGPTHATSHQQRAKANGAGDQMIDICPDARPVNATGPENSQHGCAQLPPPQGHATRRTPHSLTHSELGSTYACTSPRLRSCASITPARPYAATLRRHAHLCTARKHHATTLLANCTHPSAYASRRDTRHMLSFVSFPRDCVPALEVERKLQRHLTHTPSTCTRWRESSCPPHVTLT